MSRRNKHNEHTATESPPAGLTEADRQADAVGAAQPQTATDIADSAGPGVDEVQTLRREVEEWKDKFLRARAEQQNALRRAANERDESVRYAQADLLRGLIEVVDDFDRALAAAEQAETVAGVIAGIKLVHAKLAKFLRDHHVETIEAQHALFDPAQHEALMQQPTSDHAPGTVIQQAQRGYRLRDRVLRPAKVVVAAAPAAQADGAE
jgi:molecular chaperone GrpE